MIKDIHFVKFIKKINLIINKLIKKYLNKLKFTNLSKITKSKKFFLLLVATFFLFLSYLSLPYIYNKAEINKKLNVQLQNKLNLNFYLSENFEYNFLPRPHFIYKESSIFKDQNEISKINRLKIYISLKNLFSLKNFEVQNLIIEKTNFNLNNQTNDFFVKLLDGDFKKGKLIIKNSNIFYKNKNDEVLFINKILDMSYFYDTKNLRNKFVSKNEIFNLLYSLNLNKDNIKKKIFSKLYLNFLKMEINNQIDFTNTEKKGFVNFSLNKERYEAKYTIKEKNFIFSLFDNIDDYNISFKGEINFNPFYSKSIGSMKEINLVQLLNSNSIIIQLLKTEILNNKNLNIDLNIHADKSRNFKNFSKIYLNSKIQEGLIDIDNTNFFWKDNINFMLGDSLIYVKNGELILDGKIDLSIKNSDQIYKFLLTPKNYRTRLKNIKADFIYNFDQKIFNLSNIIIDKKNNKDVNKTLESLMFKKNILQNRIYLKNKLNEALKFYAG